MVLHIPSTEAHNASPGECEYMFSLSKTLVQSHESRMDLRIGEHALVNAAHYSAVRKTAFSGFSASSTNMIHVQSFRSATNVVKPFARSFSRKTSHRARWTFRRIIRPCSQNVLLTSMFPSSLEAFSRISWASDGSVSAGEENIEACCCGPCIRLAPEALTSRWTHSNQFACSRGSINGEQAS